MTAAVHITENNRWLSIKIYGKESRVLLEKLTVTQIVKKFLATYITRKFITVFTTARHWSLS
jgi:hypothetical protein